MPNLDGVSATHQIRQFDQLTPIISMTSNTTEDDCITYLATGMNDILAKPFSKASLYRVLERYCSHLSRRNSLNAPQNPDGVLTAATAPTDSGTTQDDSKGHRRANSVESSGSGFGNFFSEFVSQATAADTPAPSMTAEQAKAPETPVIRELSTEEVQEMEADMDAKASAALDSEQDTK